MQQRIARLLKEENLTSGRLAERIGVQPSSVSHVIAGRNKPGYDFIVNILRHFPAIDPDWLILGEGEMYRQAPGVSDSLPESQTAPSPTLFLEGEPVEKTAPREKNETREVQPHDEVISLSEQTLGKPQITDKQIDRIIVFYTDRTFSAYTEAPFI